MVGDTSTVFGLGSFCYVGLLFIKGDQSKHGAWLARCGFELVPGVLCLQDLKDGSMTKLRDHCMGPIFRSFRWDSLDGQELGKLSMCVIIATCHDLAGRGLLRQEPEVKLENLIISCC